MNNNSSLNSDLPRPDTIVSLNIGGVKFKCRLDVFLRRPNGLLPKILLQRRTNQNVDFHSTLFFDRDPRVFPAILNFYRTGRLHVDKTFCALQWKEEMDFWELNEESVSDCCWRRYSDLLEEQAIQVRVASELRHTNPAENNNSQGIRSGLKLLWVTLEDPYYSMMAKVCFLLYALLVIGSLVLFATRSYCEPRELLHARCDELQSYGNGSGQINVGDKTTGKSEKPKAPAVKYDIGTGYNLTVNESDTILGDSQFGSDSVDVILEDDIQYFNLEDALKNGPDQGEPKESVGQISTGGVLSSQIENCFQGYDVVDSMFDITSVVLLSIWLVLRVSSCPSKSEFLKSVLNIFDMLFLLMAWVAFFYKPTGQFGHKSVCSHVGVDCYIAFLHVKMVVGSMRVFRVVKFYRGTRELWLAVRASLREVMLLTIFIGIGVVVFGSLFYCSQLVHGKPVKSVLYAYWWAVITMTTVGYGDVVPTSGLSYVVGSACAMVGLVMIALPIPIIAHNFSLYYGFRCRKKDAESLKWLKLRRSILSKTKSNQNQ